MLLFFELFFEILSPISAAFFVDFLCVFFCDSKLCRQSNSQQPKAKQKSMRCYLVLAMSISKSVASDPNLDFEMRFIYISASTTSDPNLDFEF